MTNTKHDYLVALIRELEKENNSVHLDTFWAKVEGELKMRKHLHGYIDLPISQEQYDTLISAAEHLLGRTTPTTGGPSASVDIDFANHILSRYTPDQITIDIINKAAQEGTMVDGTIVNKETAALIESKIKEQQKDYDLYAFTAKQDIKKGDFVLIDGNDNQSVTPAKDMEVSPLSLQDLFDEYEKKNVAKISDDVMDEYKEAYKTMATYDEGYHSGAVYTQDEIEYHMGQAPDGYKMIWYFPPFEQYFVGDITGAPNFPFIYKDSDPSHEWVVKNTPVVGPFASVKELADYYDVVIHEHAGMDIEFMDYLVDLVTMIKHYESKNDKGQYSTIIDTLWSKMKTFLMGNI